MKPEEFLGSVFRERCLIQSELSESNNSEHLYGLKRMKLEEEEWKSINYVIFKSSLHKNLIFN